MSDVQPMPAGASCVTLPHAAQRPAPPPCPPMQAPMRLPASQPAPSAALTQQAPPRHRPRAPGLAHRQHHCSTPPRRCLQPQPAPPLPWLPRPPWRLLWRPPWRLPASWLQLQQGQAWAIRSLPRGRTCRGGGGGGAAPRSCALLTLLASSPALLVNRRPPARPPCGVRPRCAAARALLRWAPLTLAAPHPSHGLTIGQAVGQ